MEDFDFCIDWGMDGVGLVGGRSGSCRISCSEAIGSLEGVLGSEIEGGSYDGRGASSSGVGVRIVNEVHDAIYNAPMETWCACVVEMTVTACDGRFVEGLEYNAMRIGGSGWWLVEDDTGDWYNVDRKFFRVSR